MYALTRGCNTCDHEREPLAQDRIMKELAKTDEGQARIAAAAARLDTTVSELGQRHRADVPQREIAPAEPMEQHQPESHPHFFR